MFLFVHLAALAALQGSAQPVPKVLGEAEAHQIAASAIDKQLAMRATIRDWPEPRLAAELARAVSGKTRLIFQHGHGVYVEYTAPDGNLRMWYPRNLKVVKGSWGVRKVRGKVRACFRYANAINPVTQVYEPTECVSAEQTLSAGEVLQSWDGDVFRLMDDRIPYQKGAMDIPSPPAE